MKTPNFIPRLMPTNCLRMVKETANWSAKISFSQGELTLSGFKVTRRSGPRATRLGLTQSQSLGEAARARVPSTKLLPNAPESYRDLVIMPVAIKMVEPNLQSLRKRLAPFKWNSLDDEGAAIHLVVAGCGWLYPGADISAQRSINPCFSRPVLLGF